MTRARNSANLASHGNLFVDIANDRTGIGSVVPDQNLHVAGTAGFHADVTFTGDNYNTTWDRSANSLRFNDGAQIKLGTGNDANIRHDGSNTWIQNTTGYLYIDAAGSSGGIRLISHAHWQQGAMAAFYKDGGVQLFHDASSKFTTEAYGTNTTGTAVNDGLVVAGVATVTTMNVTGVLTYDDVTSVDSVGIITARAGIKVTGGVTELIKGTSGGATANTDAALIIDNSSHTYVQFRTPATKEQGLLFGDDADNNVGSITYSHSTNALSFAANASERLRIVSTGQVQLNGATGKSTSGTSATDLLMANGAAIRFRRANDSNWINSIGLDNSDNLKLGWGGSVDEIHFGIAGIGQQMTLDSSGRLLIGHTTSVGVDIHHAALQVNGDNYNQSTISIISNSSNSNGPYLFFAKQRSGAAGGTTIVQDGDTIGQLRFLGMDGADYDNPAATIEVNCDGTPGSNDIPGRIKFSTGDGGSLTERVRIDHRGQMGLGVTPNSNWPSNGDFRAFQLGTGIAVFGRGSGDEDRGGISANYYHTGSAQKYIGNGHAGRIYFEDGSIVFSNATSNSSGANAALTLLHRMIIDPDGDVLVGGHTAPLTTYASAQPRLSIYRSSGSGGYLELGGNIPNNSHSSGTILFVNNDNSNGASNNANGKILAMQRVENVTSDTNAGDDMGGDLVFMTKPEAGTLSERLRLRSDGKITATQTESDIGFVVKNTANDSQLQILTSASNKNSRIFFGDASDDNIGEIDYDHNGDHMSFVVNTNTVLKLHSGGDILIPGTQGTSSETGKLDIYHAADNDINNPHIRLWGAANNDARIEFGTGSNAGEGGYIMYNDSDEGLYIGSRMSTYSEVNLCTGMNDGSPTSNVRLSVKANGNVHIDDTSLAIGNPSAVVARISIKGTNNSNSSAYSPNNAGGKAGQGIDITCTTVGDDALGGAISFGCGGNGRSAIAAYQDGSDDDRNGLVFYTHDSVNGADATTEKLRIYPTMGVSMQTNNTDTGDGVGYGTRTRIYPYWVSDTGACRFNITMHPSTGVSTPQFWVFTNATNNLTGTVEIGANARTNAPNNAVQRYHHSKWNVGMYGEGDNDFSGARWRDSQQTQRGNTIDTSGGYYYVATNHSEYGTNANQYQNGYGGWYWHLDNGSYWQGQKMIFDMYFSNGGTSTWYAYIDD